MEVSLYPQVLAHILTALVAHWVSQLSVLCMESELWDVFCLGDTWWMRALFHLHIIEICRQIVLCWREAGTVSQLVSCLPSRHGDLKLFSRPHGKSQAWRHGLPIPLLGRWTQDGPHWLASLANSASTTSLREILPEVDLWPPEAWVGYPSPNTKNKS